MNQDKHYTIESFINEFEREFNDIKKFVKFLNINNDKKTKKRIAKTMDIIENKLDAIKSSKDIDEIKKHIKVKKLLKRGD